MTRSEMTAATADQLRARVQEIIELRATPGLRRALFSQLVQEGSIILGELTARGESWD